MTDFPDLDIDPAAVAEAEIRAGEDLTQLTADALMAVTRELHDLNAQMAELLERLVPISPDVPVA